MHPLDACFPNPLLTPEHKMKVEYARQNGIERGNRVGLSPLVEPIKQEYYTPRRLQAGGMSPLVEPIKQQYCAQCGATRCNVLCRGFKWDWER